VSRLPGFTLRRELPLVLTVIVIVVSVVAVLAVARIIRAELRPSEIDEFHNASNLTSAWSRGEQWPPPAYPEEPVDQRSSTPRQGLPRSSRT
jgi:hypothetical protein